MSSTCSNIYFCPRDDAIPWQRLETVLSVYIDMIESEKVVCIHNDVERPGDLKGMVEDGEFQWIYTKDRPDAIFADLVTGVKRNPDVMFGPWIVQPHTKEVLEGCLRTWDLLVEAIEDKMTTAPGVDTEPE